MPATTLADGEYQNSDLDKFKFYYAIEGENIVTAGTGARSPLLQSAQLSRDIYFCPSTYPLITTMNVNAGSAFTGVIFPTAANTFSVSNGQVSSCRVRPQLPVSAYQQDVDIFLRQYITDLYANHPEVTLAFSGGIDSLVLLSYVLAGGYGPRTTLISVINHTQHDSSCLHNDPKKLAIFNACLETLEPYVRDIFVEQFGKADLANVVNTGAYAELVCYSTTFILKSPHRRGPLLHGAAGNGALLHYYRQVDEVLLLRPSERAKLVALQQVAGQYTSSMYQVSANPAASRFADRTYWHKPYLYLRDSKHLYAPFYTEFISSKMRQLDYSTLTASTLFDALFARQLIHQNVNSLFAPFIHTEGIKDLDNLESVVFEHSDLNQSALRIPSSLNHHPEGVSFIEYELDVAAKTGLLPLNTVVSIKNLQNIQTQLVG